TFFCIGRNVSDHQDIYRRILDEGHSVGNHSYDHLNGWKVKDNDYISNVLKASEVIDSKLFRPPYGRIRRFQSAVLRKKIAAAAREGATPQTGFTIIMWSVLSADWDQNIDGERCYQNVVLHAGPGDIVVFHDSAKALPRLEVALPKVLAWYRGKGYRFERLDPTQLQWAAK
ncbi:MAG TPA: polysaccharide deacetylase family protein, partial [Chitinophagaceae bacterium]